MPDTIGPLHVTTTFLRLGSDASVEPLPVDETFWPRISRGELGTFHNEFLVASHTYDGDWGHWERHPHGEEVICLMSGRVTFVLELADGTREIELGGRGAYLVVPRGTWHTARDASAASLLFITAGEGTEHRQG